VTKEVTVARERLAAGKDAKVKQDKPEAKEKSEEKKSEGPTDSTDVNMEDVSSSSTALKEKVDEVKAEEKNNTGENSHPSAVGNKNGTAPSAAPSSVLTSTTSSDQPNADSNTPGAKPDPQPSSGPKVKEEYNEQVTPVNGKNTPTAAGPSEEVKKKLSIVSREGKFAAMEARKRTIEGSIKKESTGEKEKKGKAAMVTVKDRKGRLVKVLDDDEEEMDCEFLNNRQLFLELCQTNNYQFDQMRRAKHSSMMVLWHLHNRDAPKFVQQCAVCAREILSGYRYHCPTCADFDLCQDCYRNPNVQPHIHQLKPIPVVTSQKNEQTEEQRKERQRSIQLHMTLLLHAATCSSPKCHSQNCAKMKGLLKHGETCPTKAAGGCNVCKRIWTLLQIHARQCKDPKCPVPKCLAIRERFRQIAQQQRAMDDRRRQQMNIHYRQSSS